MWRLVWKVWYCLLDVYVLATSTVISGRIPTCDSAHSWRLYSTVPTGYQTTNTMTWYPTKSYYHDTELTTHLSYSNNAEHQVRQRQVSILYVYLGPGSEPTTSHMRSKYSTQWAVFSCLQGIQSQLNRTCHYWSLSPTFQNSSSNSRSGRSGRPEITGLSLEPADSKPGRVKPKPLKCILVAS